MRAIFSAPRWVLLACVGIIAITWLDVLDLFETLVLLQIPGYAEANVALSAAGQGALAIIKVLIPILIGILLIVCYRQSARLFRTVTLVLWLATVPYGAVVIHNMLLLLHRYH